MAKGAATQSALGALHKKLAVVFERVLEKYIKRMEALETIDASDMEDEMLKELFEEGNEPNPAMLNAIAAFLKQNEIRFDDETVDRVSALQQSLNERREKRGNVVTLTQLKAVGDE